MRRRRRTGRNSHMLTGGLKFISLQALHVSFLRNRPYGRRCAVWSPKRNNFVRYCINAVPQSSAHYHSCAGSKSAVHSGGRS
eukprot:jgi/Botrbrau1/11637/Bobra.0209s0027.1